MACQSLKALSHGIYWFSSGGGGGGGGGVGGLRVGGLRVVCFHVISLFSCDQTFFVESESI